MLNFQALPDELILKILSYSEIKDLISCGQVSKRTRKISHDGTLWMTANLERKIVKTELLEMILEKGCKILNICHSAILGSLNSNIKSHLRVLKFSQPVCDRVTVTGQCCDCGEKAGALEELLLSCCSLQHLHMEGVNISPKMAVSICKNGKTLQILNLNCSSLYEAAASHPYNYLQEILKCCQQLKEVDLAHVNEIQRRPHRGNMGCEVSKEGMKNQIDFSLKINILKGEHCIFCHKISVFVSLPWKLDSPYYHRAQI